ncbi:hypothetical protein C1707_12225 [Caulobacter flavus]|uniref:Uncharacterized protein n=1 Tax=Caulobacter flavus TaxID=1679497 RepID=A0ABN5QIV4_9CAUL|nr:hypothetical protein C1707_12225 [Caulobacter flavus]
MALRGPLRPYGPPPPEGEDRFSRCSPSGGAVAERLRGSSPTKATSPALPAGPAGRRPTT